MGIEVKKDFGLVHLMVLPIINVAMTLSIVYLNTQLAYMLDDPKLYLVPESEKGQAISWLTIYSLPGTIITVIFAGYIYELFGRRITIFLSFFITAGFYIWVPYTAPSYN